MQNLVDESVTFKTDAIKTETRNIGDSKNGTNSNDEEKSGALLTKEATPVDNKWQLIIDEETLEVGASVEEESSKSIKRVGEHSPPPPPQ